MKRNSLHMAFRLPSFIFGLGLKLACLLALSGCAGDTGAEGEASPPKQVVLRAGVSTRAAIAGGGQETFTPDIAGWEAAAGQADYSVEPDWRTQSSSPIAYNASSSVVHLATPYYYNANRNIYTYVKAWYPPAGAMQNGIAEFASPAMDGTQDVLVSSTVSGAKMDEISAPLVFRHPLSQVSIQVRRIAEYEPFRITKIVLKDARLAKGLNVVTGELVYAGAQDLVIFDDAAGIQVGTTAVETGIPVMFRPYDSNTAYLDISVTPDSGSGAEVLRVRFVINDDATFQPGKAYLVTIQFSHNSISAQGTIVEWQSGAPASGGID